MKIAFIYGGQGSQVEGMGYDLYIKHPFIKTFYDSIEADFPLKELSFHGGLDTISKTEYTQPIMLAFQIATTKVLKSYGIKPDIVLGLSLGEYSGLYAAGVLKEEELIKIIQYRGREMSRAAKGLESKMLAIFSDDIERIDEICKRNSSSNSFVQISNINTRGQIVVSGWADLVSKVEEELKGEGYRTMELNTSGPFHTSYMDQVSVKLKKYFKSIEFKSPNVPIIHNLSGDFNKGGDIKEIMSKQVNNTVLFKKSLEKLMEQNPDLIIEIGHKNTIKGLMKRIDTKAKVLSINTVQSIEELVREVEHSGKQESSPSYWSIKGHRKSYSH